MDQNTYRMQTKRNLKSNKNFVETICKKFMIFDISISKTKLQEN